MCPATTAAMAPSRIPSESAPSEGSSSSDVAASASRWSSPRNDGPSVPSMPSPPNAPMGFCWAPCPPPCFTPLWGPSGRSTTRATRCNIQIRWAHSCAARDMGRTLEGRESAKGPSADEEMVVALWARKLERPRWALANSRAGELTSGRAAARDSPPPFLALLSAQPGAAGRLHWHRCSRRR